MLTAGWLQQELKHRRWHWVSAPLWNGSLTASKLVFLVLRGGAGWSPNDLWVLRNLDVFRGTGGAPKVFPLKIFQLEGRNVKAIALFCMSSPLPLPTEHVTSSALQQTQKSPLSQWEPNQSISTFVWAIVQIVPKVPSKNNKHLPKNKTKQPPHTQGSRQSCRGPGRKGEKMCERRAEERTKLKDRREKRVERQSACEQELSLPEIPTEGWKPLH